MLVLRAHTVILLHCRTMAISSHTQGVAAETSLATSEQQDSLLTRSSLIIIGVLKLTNNNRCVDTLCHTPLRACVAQGEGTELTY